MESTLVSSELALFPATSPSPGKEKPKKNIMEPMKKQIKIKQTTMTASKTDVLLRSQLCPPLNKSMMEKKVVLNTMSPSVEKFVLLCLY